MIGVVIPSRAVIRAAGWRDAVRGSDQPATAQAAACSSDWISW
jgi:hypothetical protein